MENKPTLSLKSSLSMKRGSMLQNVSTTITHVTNVNETKIVASDPLQALEEIIKQKKENEATIAELKEELKQVRIDKQTQLMLIEHLNQQNVVLVQRSHELEKEVKELRFILGLLQSEGESLKTDIENFKSWTKKLDWSTANIPDALTKHYEIKLEQLVGSLMTNGSDGTISGQKVDGEWHGVVEKFRSDNQTLTKVNMVGGHNHGPAVVSKQNDGSFVEEVMFWMGKNLNHMIRTYKCGTKQYHCADQSNTGVTVTVVEGSTKKAPCYKLKNGYRLLYFVSTDEITVQLISADTVTQEKWYQLKK